MLNNDQYKIIKHYAIKQCRCNGISEFTRLEPKLKSMCIRGLIDIPQFIATRDKCMKAADLHMRQTAKILERLNRRWA